MPLLWLLLIISISCVFEKKLKIQHNMGTDFKSVLCFSSISAHTVRQFAIFFCRRASVINFIEPNHNVEKETVCPAESKAAGNRQGLA